MSGPDLSSAIEMAACSDTGRVRSHNEDSVLVNVALGLAVLADGMGGYNAGEVASGMATAMLGRELQHALETRPPAEVGIDGQVWARAAVIDAVGRANAAIRLAAQNHPEYAGMGTTLAMVLFFDDRILAAHVGDSRLYRMRDGHLEQLTRDHSVLQEQIDRGMIAPSQARFSRNRNFVTRAMGLDETVVADIAAHEVRPGDVYLLCSDGLNDMVDDDTIAEAISGLSANLALCASQLVQLANDNGGRDNVSVILAKVPGPLPAEAGGDDYWPGETQSWFK